MKHYHLTLVSKNKNTLNNFLRFFKNNELNNAHFLQKYFQSKKKKKLLTILKSPHVNKSAQEQFETRLFSSKLTICSFRNFQSLVFLKKIKNTLFPDIKIKVKIFVNKKLQIETQKQILNPTNFQLNCLKHFTKQVYNLNFYTHQKIATQLLKKSSIKDASSLLKVFDAYGELNF